MYDIAQIITMKCNGSCPYCMYGTKLNQQPDIPLDDLFTFYDRITEPLKIKITGGEPLHTEEVGRTVAFVEHLFVTHEIEYAQVNTNGYFPIPEVLLNNAALNIQVSLDGPEAYQNSIFGGPVYARIDANLDILAKAKCHAHIMGVISDANFQYVDWLVEYARQKKVGLKLQYVSPVDLGTSISVVNRTKQLAMLERRYPGLCRPAAFYCGHLLPNESDVYFAIDALGNIVNCPIMSGFKSALSIYNCTPMEKERIREAIKQCLGSRTCSFPDGVTQMVCRLTPAQFRTLRQQLSEGDKEGMKKAYGITL